MRHGDIEPEQVWESPLRVASALRNVPSSPLVELASGIDALYVSGRANLTPELIEMLAESRAAAEVAGGPIHIKFGGEFVRINPRALLRYKYWLSHPCGEIGISPKEKIPAIRIQPKAEFLHGASPLGAIKWFQEMIEREVGSMVMTASRLDVFADFQGWDLCAEDRERFICRADDIVTRESARAFSGFEIGRRKTNTVMCRIYDKTVQIKQLGLGHWPDIWGEKFDPDQRVLRVEFEINRTGLKQFGVDTPFDAIEKASGIWLGATNDWLSLRTPTSDETRSRWPVDPSWEVIQGAKFASGAFGIKRVYDGRKRGEMSKLLPGTRGYLSSVGAVAGVRTLNETLNVIARLIREEEAKGTESFESRTSRKYAQWETP
jgi:hypothetical protein